jgi:hypothetical protein
MKSIAKDGCAIGAPEVDRVSVDQNIVILPGVPYVIPLQFRDTKAVLRVTATVVPEGAN